MCEIAETAIKNVGVEALVKVGCISEASYTET